MNTTYTCLSCGATLAGSDDFDSICPACLLKQGLFSTQASQPPAPAAKGPPPIFGPYELIEEIGRGGMGVVYKARQQSLKRTVAIKLLVSGAYSSEALLRRFQIEAESAAGLQHPGIVAIYECGEHANQPFYAMEYVSGSNLTEVSGGRPLAPERAATYVRAIAEAVHYAHQRGILHRDLKPSNVLIDQDDRPRITDFGLAKRLHGQSDVTLAGQVIGSPNYASPEQISGRSAESGVASDIYSLGALLYHLLTGRPPFLASTMPETIRLVQETDPISPRMLNPDVPRDLDTICLKCLEKNPASRYVSAQALVDELGCYLKGEPIQARAVSPVERGWRWCRRHPAISALAAMVVLALTASSAVFYSSARRIEKARAEEQAARRTAEENLYAATMQAMSRTLTTLTGGDPRAFRRYLDQTRPRPGERDLRGFEWRYLWTAMKSDALAALAGHKHVVRNAFFSPEGNRIASHSLDRVLKIWDATTLKEIRTVEDVAVPGGFVAHGTALVLSRPDNSLWRLEIATGQIQPLASPGGRLITALPDGQHVVLFGADGLPVQRSIAGIGAAEKRVVLPPNICAAVSADGRRAAVSWLGSRGITVVDLSTQQTVAVLADPRPVVTSLAFSPDGTRLVSTSYDGDAIVWDVDRNREEHQFRPFVDTIWSMAFSPDGRSFAIAGRNREIKVFSTAAWAEQTSLRGHTSTVRSLAYSPDGTRIISGGQDELAMIWSATTSPRPREMTRLLRGPQWIDRTPSIAFSPDSRSFAGTAADGTVKIWRTDTVECIETIPVEVRTVAYSADGQSLLGESYDGAVHTWTLGGRESAQISKPKAVFANWQIDPLTPIERVASVAEQADTRARCALCEIPSARDGIFAGAGSSTPTIAMAPDGGTMFVGLPSGRVEAWDVASRVRRYEFQAHKLEVISLAVSADGRHLATGSIDNTTKLWDARTGEPIVTFYAHNRPVWALAFSPDGKTLAAGSCDKEIILCNVESRQHVASLPLYVGIPQGYEQEVRLLKFSPDGNILAAGLGDGTLRFFRAAPFSETDRAEN